MAHYLRSRINSSVSDTVMGGQFQILNIVKKRVALL